jgi:hypothetical protein
MIGRPPPQESGQFAGWLERLADMVREQFTRREAKILGTRLAGTTWYIRFSAALSTSFVQVHVQSSVAGEGGLAAYDASNYTSSTEKDCRQDRVQDVTVTVTPGESYVVFLVPKQKDADGTKIAYDGQSGRPDSMTFAMVSA